MNTKCDIVIVGAGACGLMCGALLNQSPYSVTIIEKNDKPGKKLLATGNGRCNFTNMDINAQAYYGDRDKIELLLRNNTSQDMIDLFRSIGVMSREKDGYVYPYTNQAKTVVTALVNACSRCEIVCETKVGKVLPLEDGYEVRTTEGIITCQSVIVATGGCAARTLGGDGSGYKLLKKLNHTMEDTYPALTGLKSDLPVWKATAGTRIQGTFTLISNGVPVGSETGEIQIVKDGVSGIPVFQLCREAARHIEQGECVEGAIDFVPNMSGEEVHHWIQTHGLLSLVQEKWVPVFTGMKNPEEKIKHYTFPIKGTFGMERAQVTAGGISVDEVDFATMESKFHKGLYLGGEVLSVDGKCGGYNLHFAWSCARTITKAILHGGHDATIH